MATHEQRDASVAARATTFLNETLIAYRLAGREPVHRQYAVGGQVIRLEFANQRLADLLTPAIEHLRAGDDGAVSLTVHLFDSESTGVAMPSPPWGADCYGARGEITGYNDGRFHTVFQPGLDILHLYDAQRALAVYWAPRLRDIPYWEQSFPIRTLLHWWSRSQPLQPIHAGAVGLNGEGVLVVGRSGSGKSTSTLACLEGGLDYAGDDYVLLETGEEPRVHSLYGTAKLEPHNVVRFPGLAHLVSNADRLGAEKALLFLGRTHERQLVRNMKIKAVLIPQVTGEHDSRLVRTTAAASALAIAPTTIFHLPGGEADVMRKVSELARRVPSYRLLAGTDLPQIPRLVRQLLEGSHAAHA